jgi:hypothetical protein
LLQSQLPRCQVQRGGDLLPLGAAALLTQFVDEGSHHLQSGSIDGFNRTAIEMYFGITGQCRKKARA